jgi:hypothetical protein
MEENVAKRWARKLKWLVFWEGDDQDMPNAAVDDEDDAKSIAQLTGGYCMERREWAERRRGKVFVSEWPEWMRGNP